MRCPDHRKVFSPFLDDFPPRLQSREFVWLRGATEAESSRTKASLNTREKKRVCPKSRPETRSSPLPYLSCEEMGGDEVRMLNRNGDTRRTSFFVFLHSFAMFFVLQLSSDVGEFIELLSDLRLKEVKLD